MGQTIAGAKRGAMAMWIAGALIVAVLAGAAYWLFAPRGPKLPPLPADGRIDVAAAPAKPAYFVSGWSGKEPAGVWSGGPAAVLMFPVGKVKQDTLIAVDVAAFVPNPAYVQHVQVTSNQQPVADWSFSGPNLGGPQLLIVPPELVKHGRIELDFAFPNATSPADQKLSSDDRKLAIFVKSIQLGGAVASVLAPGAKVDLSTLTATPAYFSSGWAGKEPAGVWSAGQSAVISLPVGHDAKNLKISVDANAFIPNKDYVQHVGVKAGGQPVADWAYDSQNASGVRTVAVPDSAVKNGLVTLEFSLPNATSPAAQNLSSDSRQLALFVKSISVTN